MTVYDIRLLQYAKTLRMDLNDPHVRAALDEETQRYPKTMLAPQFAHEVYGGELIEDCEGNRTWVPPGKKHRRNIHGKIEIFDDPVTTQTVPLSEEEVPNGQPVRLMEDG